MGTGTQNGALLVGGNSTLSSTQLFNGSAWGLSGNMTISRSGPSGGGTQNAAIASCGVNTARLSSTEIFNGSSWSFSTNLSSSRELSGGTGSQNSCLVSGGDTAANTPLSITEIHNQTLYRPLNYQNYKSAKNIGIVAQNPGGATATTVSVAFSGYVSMNNALTSNNLNITANAQYANSYITLAINSSTTLTNNLTDGFVNKSITAITNADIILGMNLSNTEIVLLGNTLANLSPWVRW